jgi:hypothetical protein
VDALLVAVQRRLIAAAVLAVCGWIGLESEAAKTWAQNVALAGSTFVPMLFALASYFGKPGSAPVSRRLVAGIVPIAYALLGALADGMPDAERASFAMALKGVLEALVGNPPPELLAAMGLAGAASVSSALVANPLRAPGRLGTPNP